MRRNDTSLRYLVMLQLMPLGRWQTTGMIHAALAERGFRVSKRTVERDLLKLAPLFGVDLVDMRGSAGKGHGTFNGQCGTYEWRRTRTLEEAAA